MGSNHLSEWGATLDGLIYTLCLQGKRKWLRPYEQGRVPMDMSDCERYGVNSALLSPEIVTSSEPMWQKGVLQVVDFVVPSDASVNDEDTSPPRPVVRMVVPPGRS